MADVTQSLIIPVFRNASTIQALFIELEKLRALLNNNLEVVFVIDGSPDDSYEQIRKFGSQSSLRVMIVSLSRNFGSFAAIRAGLEAARGSNFAVMAADLQEPIELVAEFFRKLSGQSCDVVYGIRTGRNDSWLRTAQSNMFWSFYRKTINSEIPKGGVDVFGCNVQVRDAVVGLRESNSSLVALLFWVGFRRVAIPYSRMKRHSGDSAWTFKKRLNYMSNSIFAFTDLPIRLMGTFGFLGSTIAIVLAIMVMFLRLFGFISIPGYAALAVLNLFSTSVLLFGIGVIGNYAWRAYENSKNRPEFVVMRKEEV